MIGLLIKKKEPEVDPDKLILGNKLPGALFLKDKAIIKKK